MGDYGADVLKRVRIHAWRISFMDSFHGGLLRSIFEARPQAGLNREWA